MLLDDFGSDRIKDVYRLHESNYAFLKVDVKSKIEKILQIWQLFIKTQHRILLTSSDHKSLDYIWVYLLKHKIKLVRFAWKLNDVNKIVKQYTVTKNSSESKVDISKIVKFNFLGNFDALRKFIDKNYIFASTISDSTNKIFRLARPFELMIIDQCSTEVIPKALGKIDIAKQFVITVPNITNQE